MMKVRRKSDSHVLGGWAAEYKGHGTEDLVKKVLHQDLDGMFKRWVLTRTLSMCSAAHRACSARIPRSDFKHRQVPWGHLC